MWFSGETFLSHKTNNTFVVMARVRPRNTEHNLIEIYDLVHKHPCLIHTRWYYVSLVEQ